MVTVPPEDAEPYIDPELQKGTTQLVKMMDGRFTRNFRNFHHPQIREDDLEGPRAILDSQYKLVVDGAGQGSSEGAGSPTKELFDIRQDPAESNDLDQAREMIYRLSTILRRLLRAQEAFVPLREELSMIDDYLRIEQVRFAGKLRIEKRIDDRTEDVLIPGMILQPIIENSIKHGISPGVGTGKVRISSSLHSGRLQIEVEDDGVGIPHEDVPKVFGKGIGLSNARERLEVLFGLDFQLAFEAREGGGVRVRIQIPELRDNGRAGRPESDAANAAS